MLRRYEIDRFQANPRLKGFNLMTGRIFPFPFLANGYNSKVNPEMHRIGDEEIFTGQSFLSIHVMAKKEYTTINRGNENYSEQFDVLTANDES